MYSVATQAGSDSVSAPSTGAVQNRGTRCSSDTSRRSRARNSSFAASSGRITFTAAICLVDSSSPR